MAPSRRKLEPSKLVTQLELVKNDLDTDGLKLVTKGRTFSFSESIIGGDIHRTIEGASTLNLIVNDRSRKIRNSGMLGAEVDINVDGLWFRLVAVNKSGNDLNLTFESREVAVLRTFNNRRVVGWGKMSRTRFAQILVNEARSVMVIPFVCPELVKDKKIADEDDRATNRDYGFGARKPTGAMGARRAEGTQADTSNPLRVKRAIATPEQQANVELILDAAVNTISVTNKHRRKLMVVGIMAATQESAIRNLPRGKPGAYNYISNLVTENPIGVFQQRETINGKRSSWPATGNVYEDAVGFFTRAIQVDAAEPTLEYYMVAERVQGSGLPKAYAQWRAEAERWVSAYGIPGGDSESASALAAANLMSDWGEDATAFQFTRGNPKTLRGGRKGWQKEDTWTCLTRLAEEVNWRCFEVSGSVYFISEPKLFSSAPRARISEDSDGVDWIDFNYDVGKSVSQLSITGRANRWAAPPGTTIEIYNNGPVNGRWLVTDIRRDIFSQDVNITGKKPRAKLPEPTQESDVGGLFDQIYTFADTTVPAYAPTYQTSPTGKYPTGKALRDAVLNNPKITFASDTQRMDVQFNNVDEDVLKFLIGFTEAGFSANISSLKTGHSVNVARSNRPSAHSVGRAVDIDNYNTSNPDSRSAMLWIAQYQVQFGWSQLIGPIDELVVPLGHYDQKTLDGHNSHIHVGWSF